MEKQTDIEKSYYPVFVELRGKKCVVVGGGGVAERKVRTLLDHGARVVVISPKLTKGLSSLKKRGLIEHRGRTFRRGDTKGSVLVFAATNSRKVNETVAEDVGRRLGLVNVVDTPELCSFIVPSIVKRGALSIAISTSGKSPALSKAIRKHLEAEFSEESGDLVSSLGRLREDLRKKILGAPGKRKKKLTAAAKRALTQCRTGKVKRGRARCK